MSYASDLCDEEVSARLELEIQLFNTDVYGKSIAQVDSSGALANLYKGQS